MILSTTGGTVDGRFDLLFFADRLAVSTRFGGDHRYGIEHGDQDATRLDPIPVLASMAAVTSRIGLGATRSTTYDQPYIPFAVLAGMTAALLVTLCVFLKRRDPV